jgi:hypothetical protein
MDDDDVFVDPVSADLSFEKMIHSNRQYIYNSLLKAVLGHYVMNATDIGHSDPSQNYEKMGTEFILLLLFDENIDILLCKNSQGSFNQRLSFLLMMPHFMSQNIISPH